MVLAYFYLMMFKYAVYWLKQSWELDTYFFSPVYTNIIYAKEKKEEKRLW